MKKPFLVPFTYLRIVLFWFGCCLLGYAQNTKVDDTILTPFNEYSTIPREVAYVHLNKDVLIKGETLGFAAYIFDKDSKKLSANSTNLYCSIIDAKNHVIKERLIRIEQGVAIGQFFIDSLFTSGNYTFKAYTNWMRNFEERNFYSQSIEVIDADEMITVKSKVISNIVDAQFLPEGGHFVSDTENSVGVIIKDSLGYGIPNVEGRILNTEGMEFTTFKTNEFGLGKFLYFPKTGTSYVAEFTVNNNTQLKPLEFSKPKGIALKVTDLGNKIAITFNTNEQSLLDLKDKTFPMTIHNGKSIHHAKIEFKDSKQINKVIDYKDLYTGINIITLFDDSHQPILERLFFKYDGIEMLQSGEIVLKKQEDSIGVQVPIKNMNASEFNNFSVSVLPAGTKSYNPKHTILSFVFLQPFLNGFVENGAYYFEKINRKKKFDLDLLLLTQGWSSYDWNFLLNNAPRPLYDFETGIIVNASVNKKTTGKYLIYPTKQTSSTILDLEGDDMTFKLTDFYPVTNETLKIGEIVKKGNVEKPFLYLNYNPSKIPEFGLNYDVLNPKRKSIMKYTNSEIFQSSWDKIEKLNEVIINADKEATKLEKIRSRVQGTVDVFDDDKRNSYGDISGYLISKGFNVVNTGSTLSIVNNSGGKNNQVPLVYLDNVLLFDFGILLNQPMNNVDYIVIDRNSFGQGLRGNAGVIKIFTDPTISNGNYYSKDYQEFEVPIVFSPIKRFYTPVYGLYTSPFYKEFGVIGWLPNLSVDETGNLNFKIGNIPNMEVNLYIEGVTKEGRYLSEIKTISVD